jgi:hypothetical protein
VWNNVVTNLYVKRDKGHLHVLRVGTDCKERGGSLLSESTKGFSKSFLPAGLWHVARAPWHKKIYSVALYIYIYIYIYIYTHTRI